MKGRDKDTKGKGKRTKEKGEDKRPLSFYLFPSFALRLCPFVLKAADYSRQHLPL
jgi:hypothetical protein